MIDSRDISVVIQGAIARQTENGKEVNLTANCIASLRRVLPQAEIILSTWENSDTSGLTPDILVTSKDPGAISCSSLVNSPNNVNRQIVSTINGLRRATRRYAMKVRTDFYFHSENFLKYYDQFPQRENAWSIFEKRLLACTRYSINPRVRFSGPLPFNPSDWFFFGLTADLVSLWDIPLAVEPQHSRWFINHLRPVPDYEPFINYRYTPEQYIWSTFLRKHTSLNFNHLWDVSEDVVQTSERYIANNLVVLTPRQIGMQNKKRQPPLVFLFNSSVYTHGDWLRLYKRFCNPLFKPGWDYEKPFQLISRGLRFVLRPVRHWRERRMHRRSLQNPQYADR